MGDTLRSTYVGQFVATFTVVPEPASIALLGFVAGVAMLVRSRRRK
jgi:hypothetical protein